MVEHGTQRGNGLLVGRKAGQQVHRSAGNQWESPDRSPDCERHENRERQPPPHQGPVAAVRPSDQEQAEHGIQVEDVAVPEEEHVCRAEEQKPQHPPHVDRRDLRPTLAGAAHLDSEAHAEEEGEDRDELQTDKEPHDLTDDGIERGGRQRRGCLRIERRVAAEPPHHVGQEHAEEGEATKHVQDVDALPRPHRCEPARCGCRGEQIGRW
jgi:hypothetical protein